MRLVLTSEDGRVPHAPVVRLHVNLGAQATGLAEGRGSLHLLPHLEVLLHS